MGRSAIADPTVFGDYAWGGPRQRTHGFWKRRIVLVLTAHSPMEGAWVICFQSGSEGLRILAILRGRDDASSAL